MATGNCLVTSFLQTEFQQNEFTQTGLEQLEGEKNDDRILIWQPVILEFYIIEWLHFLKVFWTMSFLKQRGYIKKNTPDDKDVLDSMLEDQENKYSFVSFIEKLFTQ